MTQNAYINWSRTLMRADALHDVARIEPVFVTSDLAPQAFFDGIGAERDLFLDPMERDLVTALDYAEARPRIRALIFRRIGHPLPAPLCREDDGGFQDDPSPPGADDASGPRRGSAIAVIDDGLGFLNARFRSGPATSRFEAVWLQSAASLRWDGPDRASLRMGRVLARAEIDDLTALSARTGEDVLYRRLHDGLHDDPRMVRTIRQAATHGTHVLDLAAGADPMDALDPMRAVPLIGVQLPPGVVDDTSGTGMAMPLIQGLRWAIRVAHRAGLRDLVVNVSLGVLAGPKDGRSYLERRMGFEIDRAARSGLRVRIVLPYGNDHDHRQVARLSAETGGAAQVLLRLQPHDATPSYVEIRDLSPRATALLMIGLILPDGTRAEPAAVGQGGSRDLIWRGATVARLYHRSSEAGCVHVLALAPTRHAGGQAAVAPAGAWTILFEDAADRDIVLQVQRDDRAAGYRLSGRQAYFDAPGAHGWNPVTRDWTDLGDAAGGGGVLRHDGTNSAYATARHPGIHSVGAALVTAGGQTRPARYASRGAAWSGGHPRLSAISEVSVHQPGLIASGTLSGSTARFSGSSAAAPTHSRALALGAASGDAIAMPRPDDRLGQSVRIDNPAIRNRPTRFA